VVAYRLFCAKRKDVAVNLAPVAADIKITQQQNKREME